MIEKRICGNEKIINKNVFPSYSIILYNQKENNKQKYVPFSNKFCLIKKKILSDQSSTTDGIHPD